MFSEIAVSDEHKLVFTGISMDLTSDPGIWIHTGPLAYWYTSQTAIGITPSTVTVSLLNLLILEQSRTVQQTPVAHSVAAFTLKLTCRSFTFVRAS